MKKIIDRLIILIISIALFSFFTGLKLQASSEGIIVNADTVNIRKETSTNSKIVLQVAINDKVEVIEKSGEWYKVKKDNKEGYISSKYIKVSEEPVATEQEEEEETEEDETNNQEEKNEEITETVQTQSVLSAGIKVKLTPNIVSNNIYTTTQETKISILDELNNWNYILTEDGLKGWVRNDNIKKEIVEEENQEEKEEEKEEETKQEDNSQEEEKESKNEKAYIKYNNVNLRKEPSTSATVIERLSLNTEVTIIEDVSTVWCKVKVGNNVGYISKELISSEKQKEENKNTEKTTSRDGEDTSREEEESKSESSKSSGSSNAKGEEIVAYAKSFLGKPYVYGGSSPSGFDCSGFTSYVYKHFGYNLARSAAGQASNGVKVEKSDLQPGDLVLFKNHALTKIGHVGIYIGDNKMIHASEPKTGVIITDIDSKSYKYPQRYATSRRIIN